MIVPVVLGFYFLVCISVVLFNCWKVLSGKVLRRRMAQRKMRERLWFWCSAARYATLSTQEQTKLARKKAGKLRSNGQIMAFHAAMDEIETAQPEIFADCMPLMAEITLRLLPRYAGKTDREQAYYAYLVTRFQVMQYVPSEQLTAFLLEQIREAKSLYNLENALRAVYSSARVPLVLEALNALDDASGIYVHEKLLVDGLLTFRRKDALIAAIWENFSRYGTQMRELLLDYIRFASGAWKEQMFALLNEAQELEVKIACLRYFGKYPDERVRPILYALGEDANAGQWELCAVCMSVLAAYPAGQTISILKQGLCSRNWYVRYNAALSLRDLNVGAELVQDILNGEDRYAREMLQYRLGFGAEANMVAEEVLV